MGNQSAYIPQAVFTKAQIRYLKIKRASDFLMALIMLLILWPILLLAMLWIKLESKGPAIFKQRRPGYHQEIFSIFKLRTMRTEVVDKNGRPLTDEERMTKSGNFLRKTSIDELPQLINILKGEMSFIGPRPFLINDLGSYNQQQLIRFDVLPGMTSWTAIHGRNNQTIQDKYNQEIYYVKHIGFKIDFEIFIKTILVVFSQKNVEDHTNDGRIGAEIMDDLKIGDGK
ncbi:MAG: sugar transferase [Clostridiales bacterium]|nr:sugar transferase [Clostridiales bacterium]